MKVQEQNALRLALACVALIVVSAGCGTALSDEEAAAQPKAQVQVEVVTDIAAALSAIGTRQPGAQVQVEAVTEPESKVVVVIGKVAQPAGEETESPVAEEKAPAAEDEPQAPDAEAQMRAFMEEYEARERKMMEELRADPAWKPSHKQTAVIQVDDQTDSESVESFCLNIDGTLLACCKEIRVFTVDGQLLKKWEIDATPQAICVRPDGTIFVGAQGRLIKLDQNGKVLASLDWPAGTPENADEDVADFEVYEEAVVVERQTIASVLVQALAGAQKTEKKQELTDEQKAARQKALEEAAKARAEARAAAMRNRAKTITGIAVTDQDLFVACSMQTSYGYAVWRMDHDLKNPKRIVKGLPGCCGQMDISARDGELWIPVNGRHRVERYDRDGEKLAEFGKYDRKASDGFGGCCEPKNLCFDAAGNLYAAESGPPNTVKKFTPEGEFQGVAVLEKFEGGCVRVTVETTPDGSNIFVLDTAANAIRRFTDERSAPTHEQVATLSVTPEGDTVRINTFCLAPDGNLLTACGADASSEVRVLDPEGKLVATWKPEVTPEGINVAPDGRVIVGGQGRLAWLDKDGKVVKSADAPQVADLPALPEEEEPVEEETEEEKAAKEAKVKELQEQMKPLMAALQEAARARIEARGDEEAEAAAAKKYEEAVQEYIALSQQLRELSLTPQILAAQRQSAAMRARQIRSIAATDQDVFVCCPATQGYGFDVWRCDHDFANAKKIVTGLRGCCGNMDIQAHDGELYVAENARGRVARFDREGNLIASFGKMDSRAVDGFGSCCNPMCVRVGADGVVYASESNVGRITRFSRDGEFLGVVGTVTIVPGCKHVPIGIAADGSRVYMLDITRSHVIVMAPIKDAVAAAAE